MKKEHIDYVLVESKEKNTKSLSMQNRGNNHEN